MENLTLSKYQKQIIEYYKANPSSNIMVNALAGTGKSTLICMLSELSKTSDIYVAFNSSIAEEFRGKITNPKTKVSTLHSLGLAIMNANLTESSGNKGGIGSRSNNKAVLDNLKIHKIIDGLIYEEMGRYVKFQYKVFLKENYVNLYNLCRLTRTEVYDENAIRWLIREHGLFMNFSDEGNSKEESIPPIHKVCYWLEYIQEHDFKEFEENHVIDFTDMLYITHEKLKAGEWKVPYWSLYTNVYVDECMPGDVLVKTNAGSKHLELLYKYYESGKPLPMAKSFNHETNKFEYKKIVNVVKHENREVFEIKTESNQRIRATSNHRFYTNQGYLRVDELLVNTHCLCVHDIGPEVYFDKIIEIKRIENADVYDIEVKDNHNFLCKNDSFCKRTILSHNCQDLSNIQSALLKYVGRKNGRYVFVSDKNQSIYLFGGANANSYNNIKKMYAPVKEFDLPICYRCPTTHIDRVNKIFGIPIQARPDAPTGEIHFIEKEEIKDFVKAGDLVISRKNKWLPDVILSLAIAGIPIYMEDKEMVENIKRTINDKNIHSLSELQKKLEKDINKFSENLEVIIARENVYATDDTKKMNDVIDTNSKIDSLNFILEILKHYVAENKNKGKKIPDFYDYVDKLLNTTSRADCVRICSVHKAKGLEADQVFVLNEAEVCTSIFNSKEQNMQEYNLSYISITRSKDKLFLVHESDDKECTKKEDEDEVEDKEGEE